MALISLVEAKAHLIIDDEDHNSDVNLKRELASGIILDYLKGRTIASVSVASPTVITTVIPHGLVTGASVTIAGTVTTPTVNGVQVITVTGLSTFTVAVAVTTGQDSTAGTVWRAAWTELTAPAPVKAATLILLGHLYEHHGDDMTVDATVWQAIERLLMRSRDPALA